MADSKPKDATLELIANLAVEMNAEVSKKDRSGTDVRVPNWVIRRAARESLKGIVKSYKGTMYETEAQRILNQYPTSFLDSVYQVLFA